MMNKSFLAHYGVLGMRWGVRRYQNYDGSRIGATSKPIVDKTKVADSSDSFTIKKGTHAYRIAAENESYTDHKRKYMSFTKEDRDVYNGDMMDMLPYDAKNGFGEYTNEFTKDVKVKRGEKVVEDLINKYGDESIMQAFKIDQETRKKFASREERSDYIDDDEYGWDEVEEHNDWTKYDEHSKAESSWEKTRDFVWDVMQKHESEVIEDYKKQGYDAIIDPFDYISNVADQPLMVLDPSESVRNKAYHKIY